MKKNKEIYVVVKHLGLMYDSRSIVDRAFTNYESAVKYADELNDQMAILHAEFMKCDDNAIYQIRTLTDAYIEKNYPDIWEKTNDEKYASDEELWDYVGSIEIEFEDDREEMLAFAKEQGRTEQDIADIQKYYEYIDKENIEGGLPSYTVVKNVELIED